MKKVKARKEKPMMRKIWMPRMIPIKKIIKISRKMMRITIWKMVLMVDMEIWLMTIIIKWIVIYLSTDESRMEWNNTIFGSLKKMEDIKDIKILKQHYEYRMVLSNSKAGMRLIYKSKNICTLPLWKGAVRCSNSCKNIYFISSQEMAMCTCDYLPPSAREHTKRLSPSFSSFHNYREISTQKI